MIDRTRMGFIKAMLMGGHNPISVISVTCFGELVRTPKRSKTVNFGPYRICRKRRPPRAGEQDPSDSHPAAL